MMLRSLALVLAGLLVTNADPKTDKAGKEPVTIQGKVTYRGKPLAGAMVAFLSEEKEVVPGMTAEDGSFEIKPKSGSLKKGKYSIAVYKVDPKTKKPVIPDKYSDPRTSGLTFTAAPGKNTVDLKLE
jgi:hypothetical protein